MRGGALAGLRRFDEAHKALEDSLGHAVECRDTFAEQGVYAGRIRALLHDGRISEACGLEPPDLTDALPAMRGEVLSSRALALACMGRLDEARQLAVRGIESTRAIENRLVAVCIRRYIPEAREPSHSKEVRNLMSCAFKAGAVDYVVTGYRASPDLLAAILRDKTTTERAGYIVARASDEEFARSLGWTQRQCWILSRPCPCGKRRFSIFSARDSPTARSRKSLFISIETVKVHVRHVYRQTQD